MRSRRWPTLPRSLERSTIGAVGLNDRVRNGNGCGPYALTASSFVQLLTEIEVAQTSELSAVFRRRGRLHQSNPRVGSVASSDA
jgi:hypothetical protein